MRSRFEVPLSFSCSERVDQMPRVDGGYFCTSCKERVHDLGRLTRSRAESLLARGACVTGQYGADGQVMLAPERPASSRRRALLVVAPLALAACHREASIEPTAEPVPTASSVEAVAAPSEDVAADDATNDGCDESAEATPSAAGGHKHAAGGSTSSAHAPGKRGTPGQRFAGRPPPPRRDGGECEYVRYTRPDGTTGYRKQCF